MLDEKSCGSRGIFFRYESGFSESSVLKIMNIGKRYRYPVRLEIVNKLNYVTRFVAYKFCNPRYYYVALATW
jgi:hypothetical protein